MRDIKQLIVDLESYTLDMGIGDLCSDAIQHINELKAKCEQMRDALKYWRDECTGYEPSISVFNLKVDKALATVKGE